MEPVFGARPAVPEGGSESPERVLALLGETLSSADAGDDSSGRAEADQTALGTLRQTPDVDAVLARIDLGSLARLADRLSSRLAKAAEPRPVPLRAQAWDLLDLLRRSSVLLRISASGEIAEWYGRILALVERSDFTTGILFH